MSSEKRLLSVEVFSAGSGNEKPIVEVNESSHLVLINVGFAGNLSNFTFITKLSPGASLKDEQPNDLTNPRLLKIQAEDGSIQDYTIIVSKVTGAFGTLTSATFSFARQMRTIFRCSSTYNSQESLGASNSGVSISFSHCGLWGEDVEDYVRLFLRNKTVNDNLKGTYLIKPTNSVATCIFGFKKGSTNSFFFTPVSGTIEITKHDKTFNVISGKFTDITYKEGGNAFPHQVISGEFTNIQIQ